MNNPGLVLTSAGMVVVDPGSSVQSGEMVLAAIKTLTDQPVVAVFNTHVHGDHWLGNDAIRAAYPQAKIYGHPRMIAQVDAGEGRNWQQLMLRMTEGATAGTEVVNADSPVDHGDVVQIGDVGFRILHNEQAHTLTDIMILAEQRGVLFAGDNVCAERIVRLDDASFEGSIRAAELAANSGAAVLVPGHGPTGDVSLATDYRDYLAVLWQGVQRLYDEGVADYEMKAQLLPEFQRWHSWPGFEEEFGKHISLAYLQAEAAAF
jgi:glyoxylase-like metal-dependent hydrolase (beta-lactamase superfamily II)